MIPGKGRSSKAFNAPGALLPQQPLRGRWGIYSQGDSWCKMATNPVVLLLNNSISLEHFLQIELCCLEVSQAQWGWYLWGLCLLFLRRGGMFHWSAHTGRGTLHLCHFQAGMGTPILSQEKQNKSPDLWDCLSFSPSDCRKGRKPLLSLGWAWNCWDKSVIHLQVNSLAAGRSSQGTLESQRTWRGFPSFRSFKSDVFWGEFGVFSQLGIFSQETLNAKLKMVQGQWNGFIWDF